MLKRPQRRHQKPTEMPEDRKVEQCAAGLKTKVMNCGISAPSCSQPTSGRSKKILVLL